MDNYSKYIAISRYARHLEDENRREVWSESVDRYFHFFEERLKDSLTVEDLHVLEDIRNGVESLDVVPSMRCVMTAGPALERDNVAGFNCSYLTISRVRAFDELMYILMCGTGVGFSVERQYVSKLPEIADADEFHTTETVIKVPDSKIGWAKSLAELLGFLYQGLIPDIDYSNIRESGAPLKTFGGRASGPDPLRTLFGHCIRIFKGAAGRRLSSVECHDICCHIADAVIVGGVRRSALISLSNLTDDRMRKAKTGQWWDTEPQRANANNSVAYTEKPDIGTFMREWSSLYDSKSGERGIFFRGAAQKTAARNGRRDAEYDFGTNPCSEIILRDRQFCNLSEVIARPGDTREILRRKVRDAAILGTIQSTLTNFRYLSKKWKENTEEERLLGVSITGIMDHPILSNSECGELLDELKQIAVDTNKEWAEKLGIPQSTAVTCVKPSGTVSQLSDTASGIHPRFAPYYIRRVRGDTKDPISQYMVAAGVPYEEESGRPGTLVFSFAKKSPDEARCVKDITAKEQLELWKTYATHWCEHKPSVTIYVQEHEWMKTGAWVYENFDLCSGLSFLPYSDHVYTQAPYEEIDKSDWLELVNKEPELDFDNFREDADYSTGSQELACVAGACEL